MNETRERSAPLARPPTPGTILCILPLFQPLRRPSSLYTASSCDVAAHFLSPSVYRHVHDASTHSQPGGGITQTREDSSLTEAHPPSTSPMESVPIFSRLRNGNTLSRVLSSSNLTFPSHDGGTTYSSKAVTFCGASASPEP